MQVNIDRPPSDYARRVYVDSLTFDTASLRFVVGKMGADRVILGSDYPFGLGDPDPVVTIEHVGFSPDVTKGILEENVWSYLESRP